MGDGQRLTFGPFYVDVAEARLWHGAEVVPLTAKAFGVLRYLVEHAGQLVTREALLEAVWSTLYVSDAALASCIRDIRRALGETAQTPQFLETIRGRGFRFHAPVTVARAPTPPAPAVRRPPLLVGRDTALAQLQQWLVTACQGTRQFVFITGEVGIGKTTLVDAFVAQIAPDEAFWIGHGQCLDHHGAGEAYLPLLEALGYLGRPPGGQRLIALLRQYAPSWLLHLPAFVPATEVDALQRRVSGTTQERMLRELAETVEVLSAERPLVLVLEDLHWSDAPTLDWLAYMARRRAAACLLVLGTYRSVEAMARAHSVHPMVQDLQVHGQCAELALDYLSAADVAAYLRERGAGAPVPAELAQGLQQRTTGNPMFLVTMVEALVRQGVLRAEAGGWELPGGLEAVAVGVPESLRQLIGQQIEQLPPTDQALLEVASVAGQVFAVAAVAAAVDQPVDEVERRCAVLARRGQFVRACGTDAWPDGTVATRYGFLHDLYRETLYDRIPAGQRVRWHLQIGQRLTAGHGEQAQDLAAELAAHFVQGRDAARAVQYLRTAGEQAVQRSAPQEAIIHCTTALALLPTLPVTPERTQQELLVHMVMGPALMTARGYTDPAVAQTYSRARELCQQVGETSQLFPALWGLWAFYHNRAEYQTARALGGQLLRVAHRTRDPALLLVAQQALGVTLFYLGEFGLARESLAQGVALYDPQKHRALAFHYGIDPGVVSHTYMAWLLCLLGTPEQALHSSHAALLLAQALSQPFSLAWALTWAAALRQCRREVAGVSEQATAAVTLATEHGFTLILARSILLQSWALAAQDDGAQGIVQIYQALATQRALGAELARTYWLALLAEAYGKVGQAEEGLRTLVEALAGMQRTGERVYEAELYRLKGELLLRQSRPDAPQAETCFQHALAVARRQQTKALELRAAMSLSRLWQQHGKPAEARQLLASIYGWFTEGFDTVDLQEARALLAALA